MRILWKNARKKVEGVVVDAGYNGCPLPKKNSYFFGFFFIFIFAECQHSAKPLPSVR